MNLESPQISPVSKIYIVITFMISVSSLLANSFTISKSNYKPSMISHLFFHIVVGVNSAILLFTNQLLFGCIFNQIVFSYTLVTTILLQVLIAMKRYHESVLKIPFTHSKRYTCAIYIVSLLLVLWPFTTASFGSGVRYLPGTSFCFVRWSHSNTALVYILILQIILISSLLVSCIIYKSIRDYIKESTREQVFRDIGDFLTSTNNNMKLNIPPPPVTPRVLSISSAVSVTKPSVVKQSMEPASSKEASIAFGISMVLWIPTLAVITAEIVMTVPTWIYSFSSICLVSIGFVYPLLIIIKRSK